MGLLVDPSIYAQIPGSSRLNSARGAGVGAIRGGGGLPAAAFVGSGPAHGTAITTAGRRPRVMAIDIMV
jgi:hypothetical protein